MDVFVQIVERIIKVQEGIMGPIALEQARKVAGLDLNWQTHQITLNGDKKDILEKLIEQYQYIFGQASVEECKDAVKDILPKIPKDQLPTLLA